MSGFFCSAPLAWSRHKGSGVLTDRDHLVAAPATGRANLCLLALLLADGRPGDITALATALRHHVRLQPESRSKLQRAMDLLNEATGA